MNTVETTGIGISFVHSIREMTGKIRKLDPKAGIPEGETWENYEVLREMLYKLEHPAPAALTDADREWMAANTLQNDLAQRLGEYVKRGIVRAEDFPFPDDEGRVRYQKLRAFSARLEEAKAEHTLTPDARSKRTEREFREFKAEALQASNEMATKLADVIGRIHTLEQELSNHG